MKKFVSSILVLVLLSINNFSFAFVSEWDALPKDVQTNEKILDTIENKLTSALDSVNAKVQDSDRSRRIEEKQQEIQNLIQQTKEDIKDDISKAEMAEKVEDVKNTVVLKAVSGVTPYTDATESISSQVDIPKKDMAKAEGTLINSMESDEWYSLMVKTKLDRGDIMRLLEKYDENLKLVFQFDEDGFSVYELTVSKNSLLRQELLENIEEGEIPNHIVGIQVIKPELLKIGEDTSLAWEDQDKLWGLRKYGLPNYENELKNQSLKLGKKIRVGIIDTGIDYRHPDLKDVVNKSLWYDFVNDDNDPLDDQGHGTHVSGTIAGEINHSWVFWVNPNVELVGLKICDDKGFCPSYAVLKALKYANDNKFDVLNMSLGGKGNPVSNPICDAIKSASENGSVVVSAAGNSNVNTSTFVPGGCPDAITVWAVDEELTRASFSNYGEKVDVSAPGVNIYSTYPGGAYKSLNGTSMATPHIVGLASIVRAYKPEAGADEIKALFKSNALPVTTESSKKIAGFVNFDGLMASLGVHTENNQPKQEALAKTETVNIAPPQMETPHSNTGAASEFKESTGSVEKPTEQEIGMLDGDLRIQPIDETEQTRINSAEDTSLSSVDTERKPETLNLNGDAKDENSGTGDLAQTGNVSETGIKEMPEEVETGSTENENASIQNAYICSITVWGNCSLDLSRANTYSYTASAVGMLSYSTTTSRVTVYGSKVGSTTFYIKNRSSIVHTIVVTVSDPARNLTATIGTTSIQNGNSTYLTITDGNGGYSVASSNTNVAQISGNGTSWTIYGKSIGSATITVRDAKGKSVTFALSVTPRSLLLNTSNLNVDLGTYGYFNITDGNGGYTLTQNNRNISIYTNGANAYKAYGNTVGSTTVQLKDSQGKTANVTVKVLTGLDTDVSAIDIYAGESVNLSIIKGNGWYSVVSGNASIATVSGNNTSWTVTGKWPGTTTLSVRDQEWKTKSVNVNVNAVTVSIEISKMLKVFESDLKSGLLTYLGMAIANVWDEEPGDDNTTDENTENAGVEINSVSDATRCELGRTGKYWVRPYNAVCVDNNATSAWKCKSWYMDLFSVDGTNSCVTKDYFNIRKDLRQSILKKISDLRIDQTNKAWVQNLIDKLIKKRAQDNVRYTNPQTLSALNVAYDSLINKLDTEVNTGVKDLQDVMAFYEAIKISSNNGSYWWWDGYATIDEYKGKSRADIETMTKTFAEKLVNYKMKYDPNFQNGFNAEVNNRLANGWVKADIERWIKEGIIEGTKDYVMGYYDAAKSLSDISLGSISNGVSSVWNVINNPTSTLASIANDFKELYDIFLNINGVVAGLDSYKKAYYPSYLWTSFSLWLIPVGKVKIVGWSKGDTKSVKEIKKYSEEFILKWKKIQSDANNMGILLTDHAARNVIWRIDFNTLVDIYKKWKKYWSPKDNQFILLKDNKYLALDPNGTGKIVTVVVNPTKTFLDQLIIK